MPNYARPRIEVYEFVVRPPASKEDLGAAEDAIGMSLPADLDLILAQYGTCRYRNGIGIGWTRSPERVTAWTGKRSLAEIIDDIDRDRRGG